MPFASHLDGQIEYFVEGSGPPLLLLHGVANDAQGMWFQRGYVDALSPHFTLIAVNSRGYGNSTPVTTVEHLHYRLYRDDFLAVLDDLGLEQAAVMGYSRGGVLAMFLAMEYPERVSALAIGAANLHEESGRRGFGTATPWRDPRPKLHPRRVAGAIRRRIRQRLRPTPPSDPMSRWTPILREHGITFPEAWERFIRPLADSERAVERLTMPALFFQGDLDTQFDVNETRALVERLAQGELVVVPGATHDLISRPERVLPIVTPFLQRTAGVG